MDRPLLVADVPWLLYRGFFALPQSITDARGRPANALLGTVNALLSAAEARPPRAVAACLGVENAAYRKALYPRYHAQRPPDARRAGRAVAARAAAAARRSAGRCPATTSSKPTT